MKKAMLILPVIMALVVGSIFAQTLKSGETYVVQFEDGQPVYKIERIGILPDADADRIVASATDSESKKRFRQRGCILVHELRDATSMVCPIREANQMIGRGEAEPDNLNQVFDLETDVFVEADYAWDLGYDGGGVTVAVLDTGVDYRHPELWSSIKSATSFVESNGIDTVGHGTHVAGVITADGGRDIESGDYWLDVASPNEAKGIAPDAKVISGKVCGDTGCYDSDVEAGIEWAVRSGADVISLSLGRGSYDGHCDETRLAQKVNWAVEQGVVVVAAAGNYNNQVCAPACASKAIAVGAVYQRDVGQLTFGTLCADVITKEGQRACFSNYGEALDIMAPGIGILSTYPGKGYAWMSGTSQATPQVSGVAALMLDKNPDLEPEKVKEILEGTANKGYSGYNSYFYGAGVLDAQAALDATPEQEKPKKACRSWGWRCNCDGKCQRYEFKFCGDCR